VDDSVKAWQAANHEKVLGYKQAWNVANKNHKRAWDMTNHPERFRKAYDPLCRPFPARLIDGEWIRCERTLLRAPDTSLAVRVAAAIIIIEERLAA
jgi:hypothetical protein